MTLNIYFSEKLPKLAEYKDFFIKNYLYRGEDNLGGKLFDVYFYNIESYQNSSESIDIILIDEELIDDIYDRDSLQKQILEKWQTNKRVIFVALSANSAQIKQWSNTANFVLASEKSEIFEFLYTEISHDILRYILNKEKLQIFISHAKKDGRDIGKLIKEYIDSDGKLDNFFDETDIQNSVDWKEVLEENVENSLFLFVYSDSYCHKTWTQKELIWAKQKRIPIVGIDVISKEDERVFPYIGNVKLVKLLHNVDTIEHLCNNHFALQTDHNLRSIINALLSEALKHYTFQSEHQDKKDNYSIYTRTPELFDLCSESKDIFYPDPPVMLDEENILKMCYDKKLYTPILLNAHIKTNKNIALSISESQDLAKLGMSMKHMQMMMVEMARYLFIQDNTLIYGGDLGYKNEFNFTQILVEVLVSYNNNYQKEQKIMNYAVRPFSQFIDTSIKNQYRDVINFQEIGEECELTDIKQVTDNLTQMREQITNEMDIKIAIGGKVTGFSGFYPGVLEEVYLAIKAGRSTYLIGGFGGITCKIIDLINGDDVEELTFEYQRLYTEKLKNFLANNPNDEDKIKQHYDEMYQTLKGKIWSGLNNKLSDKENQKLFESRDVYEIIGLVLKGIATFK
jgi:hypothetical protein